MSNTILLDQEIYHITSDSHSIRYLEHYQKVRDEINCRFNPLSGGTNWQVIYDACENLAKGPGVDLLMCGYFTVAKLKVEGISGYANGLELLMQCLNLLSKPDPKSAKMYKDVLEWVNSKVVPELKKMKPTQEQLRDLYRSERMCESIHHWMTLHQPEIDVNFEGVGFVLFEHIDRIETRYHTALKRQEKQQNKTGDFTRKHYRLSLIATYFIATLVSITGLWFYSNPNLLNMYSFKQWVEVPVLTTDNLESFIDNTTSAKLAAIHSEIVPLYLSTITEKNRTSIEQPHLEALELIDVLQNLYSEDEQVNQMSLALHQDQKLALKQTNELVTRFNEVRTKMANIALLAKKRHWSQIENEAKSLEAFAVSLSPIYGRLGYIEKLIEEEQVQQAQKEFDVLKNRLNNLSWKVTELQRELPIQHN
ncbi:type VI secretion system ImpA family N-terminal domain-containing protein [Vibrio sp. YMD68]|uniref:type VI secretion system ImpA family N-terminal domain-containing protein n=1 Tax=Vibrio sp. YMD68 TaxID=3042300 RepID=UPI00249CCA76|nr:type VI secretion system ImpA family N-terminal domain-containing protein [Vibrio sp. YMD68]WGW01273.1 type VI secretion system ImpA family N-terminal domain-containing protein [Vibrio sp. YMD68]